MNKLEEKKLLIHLSWWRFLDGDSELTGVSIPIHSKCRDAYRQIKAIIKRHFREKDYPLITIEEIKRCSRSNRIQRF